MNGTLINYYYVCKRKCWLFFHKINLEDNSEDVRIGKVLHELKETKNSEIQIEDIKIDKPTKNYVIEFKKSSSSIDSDIMQVLNYLDVLDKKGIKRKGKISFFETNAIEPKTIIIELDDNNKSLLNAKKLEIEEFLNTSVPPTFEKCKYCTKCAYYEYCKI